MTASRTRLCLVSALVASAACSKKPELDPKIEAEGHYLAGQNAFLTGKFADAHKEYDEARRLFAADPRLPAAEGEVFMAEGNIDQAIAKFEAASQRDPKRATTWSRLGYLYTVKKDPEHAAAALDKALALNPKDFNALELLADTQLAKNDVDAAIANLVKASDAAPDAAKGELVLKAAGELTAHKREAEVLPLLEGAVERGAITVDVLSELGDRLVVAGRLEDAVKTYSRAAERSAQERERASARERQLPAGPDAGQREGSQLELEREASLWEVVGELQVRLGHPAEAKATYQKSLAVRDRAVVHVAMARLCQQTKDDACVTAELDQALTKASGEELRETLDLADLLTSLKRGKDALALLRLVSEEPEQKNNIDLQLKTAHLAVDLKDEVTVKAACLRALAPGRAGVHCP
jgi:tetratricopeptide (TPR) repeat protein